MTETKAPAPKKVMSGEEIEARRAARRTMRDDWEQRTYKREIAVCGLIIWFLLSVIATLRFLIIPPTDVAMLTAMGNAFSSIYTIATTMIFVFAGAAFGIDAYTKQIK